MGGKHKQANRTKNNARPSSSSHTAELLGNTIPTFFGFSSVKDGVSPVSGFAAEKADCSIHSEFQIIFKQINKKDPTTRYKALQTFIDLCNTLHLNAVKAILPIWSRTYCTLCTDVDHKVRESAHYAHRAVVSKVKKMIAPYLKELAGSWFTSQYDTYPPAASAAKLAFEEAFPSTKLNKVLVFCQDEILFYIYDNLINQTPQSLSNPNTTSSDDMQAKYERIIISSLQGYTFYLENLSSDQIKEVEETHKKILSHQKFWKYSKNQVPLIRSCFYHVVTTLCQNAKFLLQGESSRLSSAIFNNLDESDPVALHAVWDAALNVLVTVTDCWSHINLEKQVFTKLCLLLKNGGRNVSTIYPNILPLLSKIPENTVKDKELFYGTLFDNLKYGFEMNSYSFTQSEIKILANTFIECLKYIIMRNSSDIAFCLSLVSKQLISAVEQKMNTSKTEKLTAVTFLTQTSCLLRYWHTNRSPENPAYEKLIEIFFLSVYSSYVKQLESEVTKESLSVILNNQTEFLEILLFPDKFKSKPKGKVRFGKDDESEVFETVQIETETDDFAEELKPLAKKLVVIYFKNAINNKEKIYIPAISKIVKLFEAKVIFEEMVNACNESTCFKLFTSYFSNWLMNDEMKCEELVDLSFNLVKYVTDDEKEYILEEFCKNWLSDEFQLEVCKALPNFSEDDCIIKWVRSERFEKIVLNLAERFIENEVDDMTSGDTIIMLLKAKRANGDYLINLATSDLIANIVSKALKQLDEKEHVLKLGQDLLTVNAKNEQISKESIEILVASIFKLWCYKPENENLSKTCQTGLKIVLTKSQNHNKGFEFTRKLSDVIKEIIVSEDIKFSAEQITNNINTYIEMALNTNLRDSCSSNLEIAKAVDIAKVFLNKNNKWNEEGVKIMEKCCRIGFESDCDIDFEYLKLENYLYINNSETVPVIEWEGYPDFCLEVIHKYAKWNLFVGSVLNLIAAAHPRTYRTSVLSHDLKAYSVESEPESTVDNQETTDIIRMKISEEEKLKLENDLEVIDRVFHEPEYEEENIIKPLLDDVSDFLLSVGFFESFNKYYASTKYYNILSESTAKLKTIACDLMKNVNMLEFSFIYDHCRNLIQKQSVWWLVQPTLKEIFCRKFIRFTPEDSYKSSIAETCLEDLKKFDVAKLHVHRGNYLKISAFIAMGWGHRFSEDEWDRIFIFLHNFFEGFLKKNDILESDLLILSSVSRLYLNLKKTFGENNSKPNEEQLPTDTCLAWNEVVQSEVYSKFLLSWRKLAGHCFDKKNISPEWVIALQQVSDVIITDLALRKSESLQDSVNLELESGKLMTSPHPVIQITSFKLCLSVIRDIVKLDTEIFGNHVTQMFQSAKENSSLFKKSSNSNWTVKNLDEEIVRNQGIVEILLSDFMVGDCCTVEPFTDSFTYTYSYLLMWCFLLDMCGEAHSPLRFQYGCWFQDAGYSNTLLKSVFTLMPQIVLHGTEAKENCQKYFESCGSLDFREPVKSESIEQIACFVYRLFLQRLPNVVREWWNQSENKTSALVDKVTKLYVSPILISNELKNVQQDRDTGFDNMEVKTYLGSREVIATYTIDEVKIDLTMTLPQNYPLGTVKIESSNVVVSTSKWRNWLFHISKYLIHQNGTIWDSLVIWKNNLDKKFEGVEECYICFSILQGSTFEVPRLCCHTCKKKFHSNCLYKWFSTSNKSTCPICRNLF